jgi:nucleotide-binding universal stress UspA family protein
MTQDPFRAICVPLDGSPFAEHSLPLAIEIARRTGALLQLALVHHPVPALATALEVPEIEAQLDQEGRAREQTYLTGITDRIRTQANVPVTGAILDGPVAEALETLVEQSSCDMVVIATHGRGPLGRFWVGSVADHLMRHAHVPVLILRPDATGPASAEIHRILVTLDGSPFAERAITPAVALAQSLDAEVSLLLVVEPLVPIADPSGLAVIPVDPEGEARRHRAAASYLENVAEGLRRQGLRATAQTVDGPAAAVTILGQAETLRADLLVIASHGAGGIERLVLGSVADKVIRGAVRPVLVVRPIPPGT